MTSRPQLIDRPTSVEPVLEVGRNCWCIAPASRFAALIDASDYFAAFAQACQAAERQILILGWDFDRRERLTRGDAPTDLPDELGAFLTALVKRKRRLQVFLLSWDFNMIYAAEREMLPALRLRLQAPRRFHFRLDGSHPNGASHHQKVVVIDDRVAFAGGIDLTRCRWDTSEHRPDDPRRTDPDGNRYPPFHDVMACIEGEAAARLGELARERWRHAHRWRIRPPKVDGPSPWPGGLEPDLRDVPVAIARTEPGFRRRPGVREVECLYLDAIAAARRYIYIENQYFTSKSLADALARRLSEADGPEVVLVLPLHTGGWLERLTMDVVRGRILERLTTADRHDRLRVLYPAQEDLGDDCISVHAKLLIVDERLMRIGSSNTSNRSMGLDTECDLAIEATAGSERVALSIARLRDRLLGEHLGCTPDAFGAKMREQPGLIAAIEACSGGRRGLRPLPWRVDPEVDELVPDDAVIDPSEPLSPDYFVSQYVPNAGKSTGRRRLWLGLGLVFGLLALAAAWRWTPLHEFLSPDLLAGYLRTLDSPILRAIAAVSGFVAASLLMVPVMLLVVIVAIVFGGWPAFAYALVGSMASAAIGFAVGRQVGRGTLERFSGPRLDQLGKRLARRGTLAVAVLRMVPVAPFTVFNLVAGGSPVGARQFMFGTFLGMAPGIAAITMFSDSLWQALKNPSPMNIALALGVGLVVLIVARLATRWLRTS
ncbi:MAG: VTT domain-containing protein [Burkholderiaceae bacterium]